MIELTDEDRKSISCEIEDKEDGSAILHLNCSDNMHKWFLLKAKERNLTIEEFINEILRERIENKMPG